MQMINNYLNSLESCLPDNLKQEVRDELEASIFSQVEDQQEQIGRELNEKEIEQILITIGHPMRVASAYLPNQELVSNAYFPVYQKVLELLLVLVLAIVLLSHIPYLFQSGNIVAMTISVFWEFLDAGFWVFGITTIIFYNLQINNVSLDKIYAWSPWDINLVHSKLRLGRLQTLFEITVNVIFLGWWNNWWQELIFKNLETTNPIISLSDDWQAVFWSVNIVVSLGIALSVHKLIVAGWNKVTLSANIILDLATLVILFQISQFESYVNVEGNLQGTAQWNFSVEHMNVTVLVSLGIIAFIVIGNIFGEIKKLKCR